MNSALDSLLNLPGITVEGSVDVEEYSCLQVKINSRGINCPHCQNYTSELHQVSWRLVRDLPTFGKSVYLRVPRRKFYCRQCQRYSTERLEFLDRRRIYTKRYETNIYQRILSSSVEQVGREESLSPVAVQGIFNWQNRQAKKKEWKAKRLSLDEISVHKGQRAFKTVVSDIDSGTLLEVIDSHKSEEIIEALMVQPLEVREAVEEVSIDMWAGFPRVVEEVFPKAAIVIDRFHVMRLVTRGLSKICQKLEVKPKQGKYLLLKNFEDLTEEERVKLGLILSRSEVLKIAYEMKEEFREIYETSQTVKSGLRRMEKWLVQAQVFYRQAVETIRHHLQRICNYFISRTTSGVMEGINNKIKLILRQGYGFHNFPNLRSRLLACFQD